LWNVSLSESEAADAAMIVQAPTTAPVFPSGSPQPEVFVLPGVKDGGTKVARSIVAGVWSEKRHLWNWA